MVTDTQVRRLKRLSNTTATQEMAAAKADMDIKTARKYLASGKLPSEQRAERNWRTRANPFASVWDQVRERLRDAPGLEAKTVFEELMRTHRDQFAEGQLRSFQRHVKHWRATEGKGREVFFAQRHVPGRLGQSDFTRMNELNITIAGEGFAHMLYHFVLTYSNWESVTLCQTESFDNLSRGLQNALWDLGGVPAEHRTDRLSAAVNNLNQESDFTQRYQALLRHYRMQGQRIQTGQANENGDVEQSHHRFKRAVEQALLLRGGRDFESVESYGGFLCDLIRQRNKGRRDQLRAEMEQLGQLPPRRLDGVRVYTVRVDSGSTIAVDRNVYSVHSRLIGETVEARLGAETLEVWYAGRKVEQMDRLHGRGNHRVDYRHIIGWLIRKPGAFRDYRYRDDLYPTSRFRMAWDALRESTPGQAAKQYLEILELAAKQGEARVDQALQTVLGESRLNPERLRVQALEPLLEIKPVPAVSLVEVAEVDLAGFDQLLNQEGL